MMTSDVDFIEAVTAAIIRDAKRSPWFSDIISEAKQFASEGYAWDVAMMLSCKYWLSNGVTDYRPTMPTKGTT